MYDVKPSGSGLEKSLFFSYNKRFDGKQSRTGMCLSNQNLIWVQSLVLK